jgi:hypothetical protein
LIVALAIAAVPAAVAAVMAMQILRGPEEGWFPSVAIRAPAINRSGARVTLVVIDLAVGRAKTYRLEPAGEASVLLAFGESSEEVWSRRLLLEVVDDNGAVIASTVLNGRTAADLGSITIGPDGARIGLTQRPTNTERGAP